MRRYLTLFLGLCLLLSGCRAPFSLPRAQEPRNSTIASVLGVENMEEGLRIFANSMGRNGAEPKRYEGQAVSLAGAFQDTRDQGTETVSYAHVEHILIAENTVGDRLSQLLNYAFQNGEQSIESNLWVLRDADMEGLFQDDLDLARRLSTLKTSGEAGTSLPLRSIREVTAQIYDDGVTLIPALRWEGNELTFDSYALMKNGTLVAYLDGEMARASAILSGGDLYWTVQVTMASGGAGTVQVHSSGVSVRPVMENGVLQSITITLDVDGTLMETWEADRNNTLHDQVEGQLQQELRAALSRMQEYDADWAKLRRTAGLSRPWQWDRIAQQWQNHFSTLPIQITVRAKLSERF